MLSAIAALGPAHQLEHRRQSQAALAGERGCFQDRPLLVAGSGKADTDLTAAELRAFLVSRLASYKVPKQIEFRDELPKTNVGKILRRVLRDDDAQTPAN